MRKDPLSPFVAAVNRERNSLIEERKVGLLLAPKQFLRRKI